MKVLLESADGLTAKIKVDFPALTVVTTFCPTKMSNKNPFYGFHNRKYEYVEERRGMRVYREVIE